MYYCALSLRVLQHILPRFLVTCAFGVFWSAVSVNFLLRKYSLSARILHRAPPPPAPSGPKFSYSENCCGSENAMPPKIFWDMEGHRGHFRSKNVFFFQKTYFGKKS